MKRLFPAKPLLAIAIAVGSLAAVSGAQARSLSDAIVSVTVEAPVRHVQAAPVYVQPAPVCVQHAPVYQQPAPVYQQQQGGYRQQRGYDEHSPWGDIDHDGI